LVALPALEQPVKNNIDAKIPAKTFFISLLMPSSRRASATFLFVLVCLSFYLEGIPEDLMQLM
jgi:hypothetical protein